MTETSGDDGPARRRILDDWEHLNAYSEGIGLLQKAAMAGDVRAGAAAIAGCVEDVAAIIGGSRPPVDTASLAADWRGLAESAAPSVDAGARLTGIEDEAQALLERWTFYLNLQGSAEPPVPIADAPDEVALSEPFLQMCRSQRGSFM